MLQYAQIFDPQPCYCANHHMYKYIGKHAVSADFVWIPFTYLPPKDKYHIYRYLPANYIAYIVYLHTIFLVTPGLVVYVWFVVATCFGPILIPLALPGSQKKAKEWVWRGCREQWLQRERLIINDLFNQKSQHLLSESFKWLNPKYQPHFASNESVCTIYASEEGPHRLGKCSRG
jgi:hypothetical protein